MESDTAAYLIELAKLKGVATCTTGDGVVLVLSKSKIASILAELNEGGNEISVMFIKTDQGQTQVH
jgi:hypothetical protein